VQGVSKFLLDLLKEEITSSSVSKMGAMLAKPAFAAVKSRLDYREYGGAPLLGVDGVVIVGHGRSDARAVRTAIGVESDVLDAIKQGLARYGN
ncbi:phosphate--acyl-ACP acyltransferase, partial [Chloroflexota bacterium]